MCIVELLRKSHICIFQGSLCISQPTQQRSTVKHKETVWFVYKHVYLFASPPKGIVKLLTQHLQFTLSQVVQDLKHTHFDGECSTWLTQPERNCPLHCSCHHQCRYVGHCMTLHTPLHTRTVLTSTHNIHTRAHRHTDTHTHTYIHALTHQTTPGAYAS